MISSILRHVLKRVEVKPVLEHVECRLCIEGLGSGCPLHSLEEKWKGACSCSDCEEVPLERLLATLELYSASPNHYQGSYLQSFVEAVRAPEQPIVPGECPVCLEAYDDCMFICSVEAQHRVHWRCVPKGSMGSECGECGGTFSGGTYSCMWNELLRHGCLIGVLLDDYFTPDYDYPPVLTNMLYKNYGGNWTKMTALDYCGRCGVRYAVVGRCLVCDIEAGAADVGAIERELNRESALLAIAEELGADDPGDILCESTKYTHCAKCLRYRNYLSHVPLQRLLRDPRPCIYCGHFNKNCNK